MPVPRRYLDNTIPSDNTAQIGKQQRNAASSTRLTRKSSYYLSMPTTPTIKVGDTTLAMPRSVNNAKSRHRQLGNYYLKQAPSLGNLGKAITNYYKAYVGIPDETGIATGIAPSPSKISSSANIGNYPSYIRTIGNKLEGAKSLVSKAGLSIGRGINNLIDKAKLRYAYLGSRGGSVKHFNTDNVLGVYVNRTGSSLDRVKHPELDSYKLTNKALVRLMNKGSDEDLVQFYVNAVGDHPSNRLSAITHLRDNGRKEFIKQMIYPYINDIPDLAKNEKLIHKYSDIFDSFHKDGLVYLPGYDASKRHTITWTHEDAHRLDFLKWLKRRGISINNKKLADIYEAEARNGDIMNTGAYRFIKASSLSPKKLEYFTKSMNGTELAARGTQLKNYFGLTKGQRLTPAMIKYAKNHYVRDTNFDNNMTDMLDAIYDYKKAAAWFNAFSYKYGGTIRIKKKNRGKFTVTKKRTGKTTEELTHSKNPLTRKRAIFAQNARKWNNG